MGVDQIRQCSRMKRMENGADVESAQSEICWARIHFSVTRKEEKGEEKRTAETECALASEEQKDCRLVRNAVGVLLASREVQGRMGLAGRGGKPKEEGQNSTGDNRNVQKVHGAKQMAAERDKENNVVSDITAGNVCKQQ